MKKVYFLSTCSTCKDIMKLWDLSEVEKINLKKQPLTELDLNELYTISKSYELLFNKRAILFRDKKKEFVEIVEKNYRDMIISHYSFLKRPILLINGKLFIGNSKEVVSAASIELKK